MRAEYWNRTVFPCITQFHLSLLFNKSSKHALEGTTDTYSTWHAGAIAYYSTNQPNALETPIAHDTPERLLENAVDRSHTPAVMPCPSCQSQMEASELMSVLSSIILAFFFLFTITSNHTPLLVHDAWQIWQTTTIHTSHQICQIQPN
jgi:hypothetical protein